MDAGWLRFVYSAAGFGFDVDGEDDDE